MKINVRICTTAADSPSCNYLIKIHNAILDFIVSKTAADNNCKLEVTLNWAISAKNALKKFNVYSLNHLAFGRNSSFPNVDGNDLSALKIQLSANLLQKFGYYAFNKNKFY